MKFEIQARYAKEFEDLICARLVGGEHRSNSMLMSKTIAKMNGSAVMIEASKVVDDRELFFAMRNEEKRAEIMQLKTAIVAGTITGGGSTWGSQLAALSTLQGAWFESLRYSSLLDSLAQFMVYAPVGIKLPITSAVGTAYLTGEIGYKPSTLMSFDGATVTDSLKASGIIVLSRDFVKLWDQNANAMISAQLRNVVSLASDQATIAVLVNGISPIASSGAARQDLRAAFDSIAMGQTSKPCIYVSPDMCKAMALDGEPYSPPTWPDMTMTGGSVSGVPVLPLDALHNYTSDGDCLLVCDASQLAGSVGGLDITVAESASIQMTATPTSAAADLVSLWQTNSIGLRCERYFNIERIRSSAVALVSHCNWGSGSSPT